MHNPFFTSDLHLSHHKVIQYHRHAFSSVEEMNSCIIERWNERIGAGDDVYILGDVAFCNVKSACSMLDSMNGRKFLLAGNHDKNLRKKEEFRKRFVWLKDYHELEIQDPDAFGGKQHIVMMHYPMLSWNRSRYGSFMLHGHSHGAFQEVNANARRLDVGVDTNDYRPYQYSEIKKLLAQRPERTA